jgi:hypothetical protein
MNVNILTHNDLEGLNETLKQLTQKVEELSNAPQTPAIFDTKSLADFLTVSPRTLANWRKEGKIPFVQIGKIVLYRGEDINEFITKHHIKSWK